MAKPKRIYSFRSKQKIHIEQLFVDAPPTLKVLESAWDNLPSDLSLEEREVFFELTSKLVKLNQKMEKTLSSETDMTKN